MNFLPLPPHQNEEILTAICKAATDIKHIHLSEELIAVKTSYSDYSRAKGNAFHIVSANLKYGQIYVDMYGATYGDRVSSNLIHIKEMREASSSFSCPMCGSFTSGTLDHLLPKSNYPEFSIFTFNLIPACICNSKRGQILLGQGEERILHPYFDTILGTRLLRMQVIPDYNAPNISVEIILDQNAPLYSAVKFHMQFIMDKTPILAWLRTRWGDLLTQPDVLLNTLDLNIVATEQSVATAIETALDQKDRLHKSLNNWDSIFLAGLQNHALIQWLTARINNSSFLI